MATITEDYVSFETAKLLKEKGFDARCPMIYTVDGEMLYTDVKHHNMYAVTNKQLEYYTDIIAPTQAMVMKWLREVCGLIISIEYRENCPTWKWIIHIKSSDKKHTNFQHYDKYEEACEAAIKYALKYLI